MPRELLLPVRRLERWVDNFGARHGDTDLAVRAGGLTGSAADGSRFTARLPFDRAYDGPADPAGLAAAAGPPGEWGVLLVRKGGFAVARISGPEVTASKVGQRHVQGRTKAGGQSQQRFARRRDKQAREAYEAAAGHAARVLAGLAPPSPLVTGGDRAAVDAVLADPRLASLAEAVVEPWLPVPDPRRSVLDGAVRDACSLRVTVVNA